MRLKVYILFFLPVALMLLFSNGLYAAVSGKCSNCHTMHNSQGGTAEAYLLNSEKTGYDTDTTPNDYLLKSDCAGCHSAVGSGTIDSNNTPIVFNTSTPTDPLAGGNFYYITDTGGGDIQGHNVDQIKAQDGTLFNVPPGGSDLTARLTCAGQYGCHGDRTAANNYSGIKGAHHTDDSGGITGTSIGLSYRFLNGILGTEDDDWEQDNTNASHNEYKGSSTDDSISYLCSRCHGNFHRWTSPSGVGTASPWLRHPTDIVLPSSDEFIGYTSYSMTAPVARPTPGVSSATVTPGTDIVMCLSCHRAHASDYNKILRWNIKGTLSEAMSGCIVCHTSKD